MIKYFCDLCEKEITAANKSNSDNGRVTASKKVKRHEVGMVELGVEVIVSLNGTHNDGVFCKYCIIDAVNNADDRPRCVDNN